MAARDWSQGLPPQADSLVWEAGPGKGRQDSHLVHRLARAVLHLLLVTQLEQKANWMYRRQGGRFQANAREVLDARVEVLGVCHSEQLRREMQVLCKGVLLAGE